MKVFQRSLEIHLSNQMALKGMTKNSIRMPNIITHCA